MTNKSEAKLFSVITAVYNCERYIINAIKSVLSQDYENFEYIIVDDGSTDDTLTRIHEIATHDNRIKVIHQDNQWVYAAMNRGIVEARGEYIILLNADDLMHAGILGVAADKIRQFNHPDVIWTKVLCHKVDENQTIIKKDIYKFDEMVQEEIYYPNKNAIRNGWLLLFDRYVSNNPHNFYKRSLMIKHPFRNDIYGADTYFNACIATDINSALLIKEVSIDVLEYDIKNMNVSVGKYYPYEHQMFSDIINRHLQCYKDWGMESRDIKKYFCKRRIDYLSGEFMGLVAWNCPLTLSEKIRKIMKEFLDNDIWSLAVESDLSDKLIGCVVRGLIKVMGDERLDLDDSYSFVNYIVDVATEKTKPIEEQLRNAVLNPLNPYRVGDGLYKKKFGVRVGV